MIYTFIHADDGAEKLTLSTLWYIKKTMSSINPGITIKGRLVLCVTIHIINLHYSICLLKTINPLVDTATLLWSSLVTGKPTLWQMFGALSDTKSWID